MRKAVARQHPVELVGVFLPVKWRNRMGEEAIADMHGTFAFIGDTNKVR